MPIFKGIVNSYHNMPNGELSSGSCSFCLRCLEGLWVTCLVDEGSQPTSSWGRGGGYVGKKGLSRVMWSKRGEDKGTPHYTKHVFFRPLPENGGIGPCPNFLALFSPNVFLVYFFKKANVLNSELLFRLNIYVSLPSSNNFWKPSLFVSLPPSVKRGTMKNIRVGIFSFEKSWGVRGVGVGRLRGRGYSGNARKKTFFL